MGVSGEFVAFYYLRALKETVGGRGTHSLRGEIQHTNPAIAKTPRNLQKQRET